MMKLREGCASLLLAAAVTCTATAAPMTYGVATVDGMKIAFREIGDRSLPTILLLHGVPSSSRMYDALMRRLGASYHLIALDYPGFGNSDAPSPASFTYTFDHLAKVVERFTEAVGVDRYVLFMQDYGAPVGMRLAESRPGAVMGTIFQNGNLYADGLGPIWDKRKAFWDDRSKFEKDVRDAHLSLEVTRARHLGTDPNIQAYDPDLWVDEFAYLSREGQGDIQMELIYDYRTNLASYARWQAWLRSHRPPTLVVWGKHDTAFTVPGAYAFKRDLPDARVELLDAGHFAMDTRLEEVAVLVDSYMRINMPAFSSRPAGGPLKK